MKGMVPGFVLATLAALALMTSPASAAPGSPQVAPVLSAADQEFLASLAAAPMLAAKRPIEGKALCTALCDTDSPVSCPAGTTTCSAVDRNCAVGVRGDVTCDGTKIKCLEVCPTPTCDDLRVQCFNHCPCGIRLFQCSPSVCLCQQSLECGLPGEPPPPN
jgi:hypothetical protein